MQRVQKIKGKLQQISALQKSNKVLFSCKKIYLLRAGSGEYVPLKPLWGTYQWMRPRHSTNLAGFRNQFCFSCFCKNLLNLCNCSLSRGVMRLGEKEKNEKPVNINVNSECLTVNVFISYLFNSNQLESLHKNSLPRFRYWEVEYKTNWPRLNHPSPHNQHYKLWS